MQLPSLSLDQHPRLFEAITQAAKELEQPVYIVGGYVRDAILGRPNDDIDVVTVGSGIRLALLTAQKLGGLRVNTFKSFGTAQFHLRELDVEFVGARRESYRADSRKPIVEDGTLEDDLARRDFTINALALSLTEGNRGEVVDLFHGREDLESRLIRTPRDPAQTFSDDPLRMMRAVRFASQLYFHITPEALAAIAQQAERLHIVSPERVVDEFNKILLSPEPSIGLILLLQTGLLPQFLPELSELQGVENLEGCGHKDNFFHTTQVVDNIALQTEDLWLRWAALLHDVGKTPTKRFVPGRGWTFHAHEFVGARMVPKLFRRLRLPLNEKMRFVQKMVQLHMRPIVLSDDEVTDSAVRRLLFDASDDIGSLMTLCEADITSKNPYRVSKYLNNFRLVRQKLDDLQARDAARIYQPPVSGEEIMRIYGLPPCRQVGLIKNAIKEAILDGEIGDSREEALEFMRSRAESLGLKPRE